MAEEALKSSPALEKEGFKGLRLGDSELLEVGVFKDLGVGVLRALEVS